VGRRYHEYRCVDLASILSWWDSQPISPGDGYYDYVRDRQLCIIKHKHKQNEKRMHRFLFLNVELEHKAHDGQLEQQRTNSSVENDRHIIQLGHGDLMTPMPI
jgi:hypothetical protein